MRRSKVIYLSTSGANQPTLEITLDDFDNGLDVGVVNGRAGPVFTGVSTTVTLLLAEDACLKSTLAACDPSATAGTVSGASAGVVSWACSLLLLGGILSCCVGAGKRQRARMRKRTVDGDWRPKVNRRAWLSIRPHSGSSALRYAMLCHAML